MISKARALLLCSFVSMALACGGAQDSTDDQDADTSEDELNTKARFTHLRRGPTDPDLAAVYAAGGAFESEYLGVYRFNKATVEKTDPAAREKRIKEVMHRYMCGFFDESIDIARNTGAAPAKAVLRDLETDYYTSDEGPAIAKLEGALTKAYKNPKLDILSGGASGNNTAGAVMGIYDTAHNEILFFGFTNCGSDS